MGNSPPISSQMLGTYTLRKKVGEGAMGQVWLAHDNRLDRDVAIKLLRDGAGHERMARDFLREAQAAAKLNHPNTVTIYQIGEEGEKIFIAMEYVEGGSLADELESRGAMPWREATQAIRDAAAGLQAAHERGLVHRDVKPSNLMRSSRGLVKVVDFGLAKARDGNTDATQTQAGTILGSPAYMSPEQCRGETADARSDLYSLICAYYQLLTRQIPFAAPQTTATMYQHCHEPFPDARAKGVELPDGICRILEKGSRKSPSERYQNAAELLADLDVVLHAPVASHVFSKGKDALQKATPTGFGPISVGSILKGKGIMGKTTWLLAIAALVALSVVALRHRAPVRPGRDADAEVTTAAEGLLPAPSLAAQYKADQTIRDIFRQEFSKSDNADKQALALKLLEQGKKTADDAVMRFVMFREARDLAAAVGNITVAYQAIDESAKGYAVDVVELKTAALVTVSLHTSSPDENRALGELGLELLDQAAASDHYPATARLGPVLESIAHKSKDIPLLAKVQSRNHEMVEIRRDFDAQRAAFESLRRNPADPGANLAVGRYLCFSKGNWDTGITMLAKGSDSTLQNLAKKELANPADAKAQLLLADGWWDAAARQPAVSKAQIERHAAAWYQKAVPGLTAGVDLTRAESRQPKDAPPPVKPAVATANPIPKVTSQPPVVPPPPTPSTGVPQPPVRVAVTEAPVHTDAAGHRVLDLLAIVDPDRCGGGSWKREGSDLTQSGGERLTIPYEPPDEYDFTVEYELQKTPPDHYFVQIVQHGDRYIKWVTQSKTPPQTEFVFDRVLGFGFDKKNPTYATRSILFTANKRYTSQVQVRKGALAASFDQDLLTQFATDFSNVTVSGDGLPGGGSRDRLVGGGLGLVARNGTIVRKIELTEISGKGHYVPPPEDPHLVQTYSMMEADHAFGAKFVRFTPDGRSIISIGKDVIMWDRASGKTILYWHNDDVPPETKIPAAISADGRFLAATRSHHETNFVDTAHPESATVLNGANMVLGALSPDGSRLAVVKDIGDLTVWDPVGGKKLLHADMRSDGNVRRIIFSPDGLRLLCTHVTEKGAFSVLWDARTLTRLWSAPGHEWPYFSPDGTRIITGKKTLLNAADGKVVSEYMEADDQNPISPDGKLVVPYRTFYGGTRLTVCDTATGTALDRFTDLKSLDVTAAAWSPAGDRFFVGCRNYTMHLIDTKTGEQVETYSGYAGPVCAVAISPDGKFAASVASDGKIRVFSLPAQ